MKVTITDSYNELNLFGAEFLEIPMREKDTKRLQGTMILNRFKGISATFNSASRSKTLTLRLYYYFKLLSGRITFGIPGKYS
mmetsp:Transcript_7927/g.12523  ORF Transcript_7927/g.12523 Transcript_7927/m.12523 type:complete len:82 (+) Transcript_7927:743-988(+)